MRSVSHDYSVVIPAYNEEEYLPATLRSLDKVLRKIPQFRGEVIVVNNGSTDRTAQIAEQYGAKVVEETNRGIGRARNRGAAMAKGETLISLDADTWLCLPTLKTALEQISNGICGLGELLLSLTNITVDFFQEWPYLLFGTLFRRPASLPLEALFFVVKKILWKWEGFQKNFMRGKRYISV